MAVEPTTSSTGAGVSPGGAIKSSRPAAARAVENTQRDGESGAPRAPEMRQTAVEREPVSGEALAQVAESLNQEPVVQARNLQFQVNDEADLTVIFVRERDTGDTVKQIPPKELVTLAEKLQELSEQQNLGGQRAAEVIGQLLDLRA